MRQTLGHDYGTKRSRIWDKGQVTFMGQRGHVNGTGLKWFICEPWPTGEAPSVGQD